jgi:cytoskeletal protein CcmA (bactofilin family)
MAFFKKEQSEEEAAPAAAPRPRPENTEAPAARGENSVISKNIKIVGEITGSSDLLIDGRVEGKIRISKLLTIGPTGDVMAEIHGENVIVIGRVNGNVSADQKVILKPTASVTGNINCHSFVVNEGASFEGNIHMKTAEKKAEPATPLLTPREKDKDKEKPKN